MQPGPGYEMREVSSNPGDERTKKLYALWDKLSKAEQEWRKAGDRAKAARMQLNSAATDQENRLKEVRAARMALDAELMIPAETKPEPVR